MIPKLPQSHDGSRSAEEERRRRILIDPPDPGPEEPGYLAAHGVELTATALVRHGDRFLVLPEWT